MKIPTWLASVIATVVFAAIAWGASEIVDLRTSFEVINTKLTYIQETVNEIKETQRARAY